mgnify:CR=1 FL=1
MGDGRKPRKCRDPANAFSARSDGNGAFSVFNHGRNSRDVPGYAPGGRWVGSGSDDVALPADVVGVLNGKECVWAVGRVDKLNHIAGILECLVGAG